MCWGYRIAKAGITAEEGRDFHDAHVGRVTISGRETVMLTKQRGHLLWSTIRYGMMLSGDLGKKNLFWNARDDKLDVSEAWSRLIRQRCVVPIDAFVENNPKEEWHTGKTAWALGLYDTTPGGGMVLVTEDNGNGGRRPILTDLDGARSWINAKQWDAIEAMRKAARTIFTPADIFDAKTLAVEARTKVPLVTAKKAA